jgi:hypothetical protein
MKLSRICSRIKCLIKGHDWEYNNPKDEILFCEKTGEYIEFNRFCLCCYKKEKRQILDMGRNMIWVKTEKYTKQELRKINLRRLLEE